MNDYMLPTPNSQVPRSSRLGFIHSTKRTQKRLIELQRLLITGYALQVLLLRAALIAISLRSSLKETLPQVVKDVFDSQLDPVKGQALYMQRPRRNEKKHTASDGSCDNNSVSSCNMFKYGSNTASHLGNETARTIYKRKSVHKSPNRRANPFQPSCSTKIDLKSSCDVVLIPNTNTWALDTSTRLWLRSTLLVN